LSIFEASLQPPCFGRWFHKAPAGLRKLAHKLADDVWVLAEIRAGSREQCAGGGVISYRIQTILAEKFGIKLLARGFAF
jgi:hypothetical protein